MPAEIDDISRAIVEKLHSYSDLTDLVGDRISGSFETDPDSETSDYPRVTVNMRPGGTMDYYQSYDEAVFELAVFSQRSAGECLQVYAVALKAIQAERIVPSDTNITNRIVCRETARPEQGYMDGRGYREYHAIGRWMAQSAG